MKSISYLGIALCLSLLAFGCDEAENTSTTTDPSQPTTSVKDTERPEGIADKEENKTLTPTDITPPKVAPPSATKSAEGKSNDPLAVPSTTPPAAVRSVPQNVPNVNPLEDKKNESVAIAQTFDNPDVSDTIIPYLIANKNQIGACQDIRYEPEFTQSASNVYRVGENQYLAHFVCGSTAYQSLQEYYLYEQTTDAPLITVLPITYLYTDLNGKLIEESERAIAGYSEYDPATQTINIFTKGRGLGDCGSLGFYRLEGSQLVVNRFLAKDECDGNYIDPINYPQVYPQ
ncbi:hypothetical protein Lepto7376_0118 [[Leptolyngbya] sp. PCC 7376]|uniref:DUF1176 domain-containing protein n=1 Tax=[Leptolyngbya] sp. PCC 7376 TaxID=111781 RepID=UPI00029EFBF6|nr:DUF1176 domain-containing protein [[Leptolyngbya] sp. PCC 7376]AFY36566.1 hypothetical protein Lepto7376_0118 [[Leptolyngbya] sp. PCC 7376]